LKCEYGKDREQGTVDRLQ